MRRRKIFKAVAGLGVIALLLSIHLMETWPTWALWVAVAGAVLWIIGKGGAVFVEPMEM